jgi:predicted permease
MNAVDNSISPPSSFFANAKSATTQWAIFLVGLCAMMVSGWYLIEGMLHFAGDDSSKKVFIAAGIIFQITESICFVSATAFTTRSWLWRGSLFSLGSILFIFSIAVMTLAQKATLQSGDNQAKAMDLQIGAIKGQIKSLDNVIAGYRLNAEKQSKSVYANSRELGQDSLNRATEIEEKKLQLANRLFDLQKARKQTSADFFKQLESITGLPALKTEFYFLTIRSVLMELCGIVLMAFAAHLRTPVNTNIPFLEKPVKRMPTFGRDAPSDTTPHHETGEHWARSHIQLLKQKQNSNGEGS